MATGSHEHFFHCCDTAAVCFSVCEAELCSTKGTVMQKTAQQWTLFLGLFFCLYGRHCAWWADWVINDAISVIYWPASRLCQVSFLFNPRPQQAA